MCKLAERYLAVRRLTEALIAPLSEEDCALQSMPDASPSKWHLAHTSWFFERFLLRSDARGSYRPFHEKYDYLFNSYYDAVGPRHARAVRGLLSRPSLAEVLAYRAYVDEAVCASAAQGLGEQAERTLFIGCHHEEQHQELILTDIKHLLWCSPLYPRYRQRASERDAVSSQPHAYLAVDGGVRFVGEDQSISGERFAFDHECPRHEVLIAPYRIGSRLVTNGEFLAFMEAGGYRESRLWLSDGWQTVIAEGWQAPLYWVRQDGGWFRFGLFGLQPLELEAPVSHVSFYEADAYARFVGARLPTEAEWEIVARAAPLGGNLLSSDVLDVRPASAVGVGGSTQLIGDAWEWTASAFLPYPRARQWPGAFGEYNAKFMSGQMVLRGGSAFTPDRHIRPTYRNYFPPAARWQLSGIRLAQDF